MNIKDILKAVSILFAAYLIGNWYFAEVRKAKALGKPWYAPYLTLPGIIILVAVIVLPILYKVYVK